MIVRILLMGVVLTVWLAMLFYVGLVNSLPGTETEREIWNADPVLWWLLVAAGPAILVAGSVWASRAKRRE